MRSATGNSLASWAAREKARIWMDVVHDIARRFGHFKSYPFRRMQRRRR